MILLQKLRRILLIVLFCLVTAFSVPVAADVIKNEMREMYWASELRKSNIGGEYKVTLIDSLIRHTKGEVPLRLYIIKGQTFRSMNRLSQELSLYDSLLSKRKNVDKDDLYIVLLGHKCVADLEKLRLSAALDDVGKIMQTNCPDSLLDGKAFAYINASEVMTTLKLYDKALDILDKGVTFSNSLRNSAVSEDRLKWLTSTLQLSRIETLINSSDYDAAYNLIHDIDTLKMPVALKSVLKMQTGELYYKKEEYAIAEKIFRELLDCKTGVEDDYIVLTFLLETLTAQDKMDEAERLMNKYGRYIESNAVPLFLTEVWGAFSEYEAKAGNYERAYFYAQKRADLVDRVSAAYLDKALNFKGLDGVTAEEPVSFFAGRNKYISITVIAICLIMLALTVWWYMRSRRKNRKSDAEDESNLSARPVECPKTEADPKSLLMHVNMMSETLDRIRKETANQQDTPSVRINRIKSCLKNFEAGCGMWDVYMTYARRENPVLFNNLYALHPDLSSSEIRLCSFIVSGMSSKEIAMLTNRSLRTIQNTKYTLRKKLKIQTGTEEYLRNLSVLEGEQAKELRTQCRH